MEYIKRAKAGPDHSAPQSRSQAVTPSLPSWTPPEPTPLQRLAAGLSQFTSLPVKAKRQAVHPLLQAATLQRAEEQRLSDEHTTIQRQFAALPQTNLAPRAAVSIPSNPVTAGDWVTVMRQQAEQIDGQLLGSRERDSFLGLQRQVTHTLVQSFRQDRQAPDARYVQYGEQLATLQRHPNSASVSRVVLSLIPQRQRLPLQRAVDEALQRQIEQEAQEQTVVQRQALQRKKAELDEESLQPVMQRIAARRGAGNPLPAAIQRHLEQGLNHDLSQVRIHDDAEADKLSKSVQALAFTTGMDIFFQAGQFNPNTQSGLELLAHEVTHTTQQAQGRVGTGIDPDAGLEAQAQAMGKQLAVPFQAVNSSPQPRLTPQGGKGALQRLADPQQTPLTLAKDGIGTPKPGIYQVGFIKNSDGAHIRTAPAELTGSKELLPQPLPPGTRVFVSGTHPQKPEWLYVTATLPGRMVRGYVQNLRITTTLPEPSATLYFVKKGKETLRPLALEIYKQDVRPGRDLRFYEQTVLYLTQNASLGGAKWGTATVTRDGKEMQEQSVLLMKDEFIWLPSPAFANTLSGKVPSGSITGGAVAQAKTATRHLDDILSSIKESPKYLGKIGAEYKNAILDNLPQILGVTAAFIAAEGLSVALAATPTGVGQLAAAAIQMGLGAWGAVGAGEAIQAAMPYAQKWLMTAWQANGDAKQIALASENFLYMVVQIALAAMALLGGKLNMGKGMKLAENVKVTPPTLGASVAVTPNGQRVVIPVFKPGRITVKPGENATAPQATQDAAARVRVGGTAVDAVTEAARKLLGQLPANWPDIRPLIGKPFDSSKLPGGYRVKKFEGEPVVYRDVADSKKFTPVTIDEAGNLQLRDPKRLSNSSTMKGNFKKAYGPIPQGYWIHHLIPDSVIRNSPLGKLLQHYGYDLDRASNLLGMPGDKAYAKELIDNPDVIGHWENHGVYDRAVKTQMENIYSQLDNDYGDLMKMNEAGKKDLFDRVKKLEDDLRQDIKEKKLPVKLNGTLAVDDIGSGETA
jgi:hypothetical protein